MPKFLVVYQIPDGIAHIDNVGIFDAQSANEATLMAKEAENTTSPMSDFHAYRLDELEHGWRWYT